MFTRSLGILIAAWLPALGLILPFGAANTANALVAGTLGTVFAALSLADDRARIWAAIVGGWVALFPFLIPSTLLEEVVAVSWGVNMFVLLIGPFSHAPTVVRLRGVEAAPAATPQYAQERRAAA